MYASYQDDGGDADIYAVRVDGSETRQLTDGPGNDFSPDLSPDGQRVVFVSDRDGNKNLYMVNIDGSHLTQLTYTDEDDDAPDWSPDGQSIVFTSSRSGSTKSEIWTARVNATGIDPSSLTLVTHDDFNDYDPAWSPDGRMIAYSSLRIDSGKGYTIFVINADGSQNRQVTTGRGFDRSPQWSADGQNLIFVRWATDDIQENRRFWFLETQDEKQGVLYTDKFETQILHGSIYITRIDGTGTHPLVEDGNDNWAPCWSPDGQWVAFISDRDGDDDIYIVKPDGSQITPVTNNTLSDFHPSWGGTAQGQISQWRIIFSDPFDNNRNNWLVSSGMENDYWFTLTQQIANGVYRWEVRAKRGCVQRSNPGIRSVTDFLVSVAFRQISGDVDTAAGVAFRDNGIDYYLFEITPGLQEYSLYLWHNNDWKTLIHQTPSSTILPEGWNRIEVQAVGSLLSIWINGVFVDSIWDETLSRGDIELAIGVVDPGDEAVFEFDNFEVSVP